MDELIVRIARTLACMTRLKIMSHLARKKEAMPSALARDLGMGLDAVCMHLRRLSDAGLIVRRRSGARCYCVAASAYSQDTISGKMSGWMNGLLADPGRTVKNYGVDQLRNSSSVGAEELIHGLLFEAMTAFTNVRRLAILRRLAKGKPVTVETLMNELRMSDAAVSRHMGKLLRRGYVRAASEGRCLTYRLSDRPKSALHKELYAMVAPRLEKATLRS